MANSDRDIVIVPDRGASTHPAIYFTGADSLSSATIVLRVYNSGTDATLSFEGDTGQIFSLTDSVLGPVFSVNDVTGIPSIEVFDTGEIRLSEYNGYVNIAGTQTASNTNTGVLRVAGGVGIARDVYIGGNATVLGTLTAGSGGVVGTVSTATTVAVTDDSSNASVQYVTFVSGTSGTQGIKVDSNSLAYVPSTNSLGFGTTSPYGRLSIVGGAATEGLALFTSSYEASRQWGTRIWKNDVGGGIPLQIDQQYTTTWYTTIRMSHGQDTNHPALITYYNTQLAMNSGNVGVGVVPTEKLHISGTVRIDGTTNGLRIFKNGSNSLDSQLYIANAANTRAYNLQLNSDGSRLDMYAYDGSAWNLRNTFAANGNVGIGTTDFSYTTGDNTRLVGSYTNNKLFVNGSIQLLGGNDAIVIGRGAATFLTDEELGFGWGGGWWMNDATYLRVRNYKHVYNENIFSGSKFQGYSTSYNQPNMFQVRWEDVNWAFGSASDDSTFYWMQVKYSGNGDNSRGFRVLDAASSNVRMAVGDKITTHQNTFYRTFQNYTGSDNNQVKTWDGVLVAGSDNTGANSYTVIETSVPQDSYMMGGFTIHWFESYSSTNGKTLINLSGYWNAESNGGFIGWEYTSSNPNITPTIQVGRNASNGKTVFILTHFNSNYAIIVARDLWLGYSSGNYDYGSGWTISQTGSLAAYTNLDTVVPRTLGSGSGGAGSGINADLLDGLDSTDFMRRYGIINNTDDYVSFRVMRNNNSSSSNDGMYIGYGNTNSGLTRIFGGGATSGALEKYSTYTLEPGSFRAPIFYDSANTTYYLDPDSTGTSLNLRGEMRNPSIWVNDGDNFNSYNENIRLFNASNGVSVIAFSASGTSGTPTTSILGYSDRFETRFQDQWQTRVYNGYAEAYGSYRAPIFYDSNDTAYFGDFGNRRATNINGVTARTKMTLGLTAKYQLDRADYTGDSNYWTGVMGWGTTDLNAVFDWGSGFFDTWSDPANEPAGTSHWVGTQALHYTNGSGRYGWQMAMGAGDPNLTYIRGVWGGSFSSWYKLNLLGLNQGGNNYASVYYDSDDTAYFGNFNGISSVYGIAIRGDNSSTDSANQIFFWGAGDSTTSAIGFKANGGEFPNPTGFGDGYNTYLTMDSDGRGWVFRRGTGGSDFNSAYNSGWILNNGVWQANSSMRAPIFYDSNNTSYYCDPNSDSIFYKFQNINQRVAYDRAWGSYPSITVFNTTDQGPQGDFRIHGAPGSNGGDFSVRLLVDGTIESLSDVRAPIFYDSGNTGYYLDPQNTSNLNTLFVEGNEVLTTNLQTTPGNLGWDLHGNYAMQAIYGNHNPLNNGHIYNAALFRGGSWTMYGFNGSSWVNLGTVAALTDGFGKSDWGGVTLSRSYSQFIIDCGATFGYTFMSAFTLSHSTSGNSMDVYFEKSTSSTYNSGTWTTMASATGVGSWPGGTSVKFSDAVGGGYPAYVRLRIIPNWAHPSNEISLGQFFVTAAYGGGNQLLSWDSSYNVTASGSFRAPIFYDSDNTSYYLDPAGTSVLNSLTLNGSVGGTNLVGEFKALGSGINYDNDRTTKVSSGLAIYSGYSSGANRPTTYDISAQFAISGRGFEIAADWIGSDDTPLFVRSLRDCCINWSSWSRILTDDYARASIFYDRDDTGYYVDPNSTTNLNNLYIQGGVAGISNSASYTEAAIEVRERNFGGAQDDTWATAPRIGFHWGGRVASQIAMASNGRIHILNNPGNANEALQSGTFYAPIFYDSDDTGYYVNPNGDSRFAGSLTISQTNATGGGIILADDGDIVDLNDAYCSMRFTYGVRVFSANRGGSAVHTLHSDGNAYFNTSARSPIFYDNNDTGYYCDPNSTSNLNTVSTEGTTVRHLSFKGEGGDSGNGTRAYSIYQEGGAWTNPYPDLRIGFHTGIKMGSNANYEGIRLYTDYDMSSRVIQFNGSSNYIYADRWINVSGNQGIYSATNGAHFYPNNASYGSWRIDGTRNGWYGIEFGSAISLMMNADNHGFHYNGVGWRFLNQGGYGYFPGEVVAYWSDRRLKENIKPLERGNGIALINKLVPSKFNWRNDLHELSPAIGATPGAEETSLIAQEVQEVLPIAVTENKSGRKVGQGSDIESYLTVKYDKIAPFLIQAVKDLKSEIDDLKEEIERLRGMLKNGSN